MKKIKLIMPMLATAGIAGMAMPLASCSCGNNDPSASTKIELTYKDYTRTSPSFPLKGYFNKNAKDDEIAAGDPKSLYTSIEKGKIYTITCELTVAYETCFTLLDYDAASTVTTTIENDDNISIKHDGTDVPFTYLSEGTMYPNKSLMLNWPSTQPSSGTLVITFKAADSFTNGIAWVSSQS